MRHASATGVRRRRRRPLLVLLAAVWAATLPVTGASAAAVAELTVVAHGAQRFDLATGFTELPDGGEVVERTTGVRLVAPWLRYAEGSALEATDATVEGPFGRLEAPRVAIDLAEGRLEAEGGVVLVVEGAGTLRAERIRYDAGGWAVAEGAVEGDDPALAAAELWAEADGGRLVLVGPYVFDDGLVRLRSETPGAALQLTPVRLEDGTIDGYDASTTLDHDVDLRVRAERE